MTDYVNFNLQLKDGVSGRSIIDAGGTFVVLQTGLADRQTCYSDASGTTLTKSAGAPTRGKISFWAPVTVSSVDIIGFAPGGQFFYLKSVTPSGPNEVPIDTNNRAQVALIPYSIADMTAATEYDTMLDLPDDADVSPFMGLKQLTASSAGNSLDFGTLSSETGGDADAFLNDMPTNGATTIYVPAKSASTATRGAKLGSGTLDYGYSVNSLAARSLSVTLATSFAAGKGFIVMPYTLTQAGAKLS